MIGLSVMINGLGSESPHAHLSPCVLFRYNTSYTLWCAGIPNLFPVICPMLILFKFGMMTFYALLGLKYIYA